MRKRILELRPPVMLGWMIVSALPLTSPLLHAGAMTDGSVGAVQTLSGNFTIPQTLGQISGANLFHSFQSFSINAGESATFTATSAFQNVISRVTGGTASNINGMLRLAPAAGSSPNFFFINPAGVTFGAGAAVDVPAGFHVSTANYLKFPDGNFHADTATASTFSSAPPEAFGFLGTTRATSTINGGATLSTQPSQPISIVGGDILIDNGAMSSQGGDTLVVAMGQNAGEVGLAGMPSAAHGSLSIINGGYIDTRANFNNGGNIFVSAGNILIDNAYIFSDAQSGTGDAGNVTMLATGDLSMVNGGYITADTYTSGIGGAVEVSAANITIDRQTGGWTGISSNAASGSAGNAGLVSVMATGTLLIRNGGQVGSNTFSSGDAGWVTVNAGAINIDGMGNSNFTGIASHANPGSTGNAGFISVMATGALSVFGGGEISSNTFSWGNAGSVIVDAGTATIDGRGNSGFTGIASIATSASTGSAGSINVLTAGALSVLNGGQIVSDTYSTGNAGWVTVNAGAVTIDSQGGGWTGISSDAMSGSGNAGLVSVTAAGTLSVVDGGQIGSSTYSSGNAGSVTVNAGTVSIDSLGSGTFTGIASNAKSGSTGNAGSVDVTATGALSVLNGGRIASDTYSPGDAGWVVVNAGSITIDRQGGRWTGISSDAMSEIGNAGLVSVTTAGTLSVIDGGAISSNTYSPGNAGYVVIDAGAAVIDGRGNSSFTGIASNAESGSSGNAGFVWAMATGTLSVLDGGQIGSNTFSSGNAGNLMINAGAVTIDGRGNTGFTGIASDASPDSTGKAGLVSVMATGPLSVLDGGRIGSNTFSSGDAGYVILDAGSITIDGMGSSTFTGIASNADMGSSGNAGFVWASAAGTLSVLNGGEIGSNTFSSGNAGYVKIDAGAVTIDGGRNAAFTGIASNTTSGSTGNAGYISVTANGALSVLNGGAISSTTAGAGSAGYVDVSSSMILVDGNGSTINAAATIDSTSGQTGYVGVRATQSITVSGNGEISVKNDATATVSPEAVLPGTLFVSAPGISVDGGSLTASTTGNVKAGDVLVNPLLDEWGFPVWGATGEPAISTIGSVSVTQGGTIASATSGAGSAGSVYVSGNTILVDGGFNATASSIDASATTVSSGQTGSVVVTASGNITLSNGGKLAIQNDATVADPAILVPTMLTATAPSLTLQDAQITAASTGNVAASDIQVSYTDRFVVDPSAIATSAVNGNGGSIVILGAGPLTLDRSQITSSVLGALNGNGGNITISVPFLLLNTGFIQANTLAATATGGTVSVNVNSLLSSGSALFQGGALLAFNPGLSNFNVIQASAPNGVNGVIQISSPQVDLSSSLAGLSTQIVNFGNLGMDICRCGAGSSLTPVGKGGLPPTSSDLLRPGL